jgi:1-acyl-sn-glycerol-3-phosphate acyltransferase
MIFDQKLLAKIQHASEDDVKNKVADVLSTVGVPEIVKFGNIPHTGPVLVISNHTGVFDTLILFSNIDRHDYYFVALATYGIFGPQVTNKLLPIYRKRQLHHSMYEYPLSLQIRGTMPENISSVQIRTRNRNTVSKAAQIINNGKVVSVFPTGSVGKALPGSLWKPGIGFLVKQITHPDVIVVLVKITGTKQSDFVAYMKPFIRKLLFRPRPVSITFSKPHYLGELVSGQDDAKEITKKLENHYMKAFT